MDRLTEMEAFAAVVDQGGFTGAATKLGMSKSAVSKHVSSLENRLGARLLNRTTRRVNPTDIGLLYYDRARQVLSAATEADASVTSLQSDPSGTLQLVVSTDFGATVLSPLITSFLNRYQDMDVNMVLTNRYVELVSEGYDLALRIGAKPDSSMQSHRLDTITQYLVASPEYLARSGRPSRIEDLAQHQLLHFHTPDSDPNWSLMSHTGERRIVRTKGRMTANSGLCLREHALAGMGIAFLPDFLVGEAMADGKLCDAMPSLPPQKIPLYAIYPPNRGSIQRVRTFVDFLNTAYSRPVENRAIA
ncbi:MAG: LysR family transcriptional regulator [Pseudomonadota bacterium]